MGISVRFFFTGCFLLAAAPLGASGVYYPETYSLRQYGYEERNEFFFNYLAKTYGSSKIKDVWDRVYSGESLRSQYKRALELEAAGHYQQSLKIFRKLDSRRLELAHWPIQSGLQNLILREAADRLELYTIEALQDPSSLKAYLQGREAFLKDDYAKAIPEFRKAAKSKVETVRGWGRYMELVCGLRLDSTDKEAPQKFKAFLKKNQNPRVILSYVKELAFPTEAASISLQEGNAWLDVLLEKHPQSRYADDALYLKAVLALVGGDWNVTRKAFKKFIAAGDDDLVARGRILQLADQVQGAVDKEGHWQALWELCGKSGSPDFEGEASFQGLPPVVETYFLYHWAENHREEALKKCREAFREKVDLNPKFDRSLRPSEVTSYEKVLGKIVKNQPGHPVAPLALLDLASFARDRNGYGGYYWEMKKWPENCLEEFKYRLLYLDRYPESPDADKNAKRLIGLDWMLPGPPDGRLLASLEKAEPKALFNYETFQSLAGDLDQSGQKNPDPFKTLKLKEMLWVGRGQWEKLIEHNPAHPMAMAGYLQLVHDLDEMTMAERINPQEKASSWRRGRSGAIKRDSTSVLKSLRKYASWYRSHGSKGPDMERILLTQARVKLDTGDFPGAVREADEYLRSGGEEWKDAALWIKGSALERRAKTSEALSVFEQLVKAYPVTQTKELFKASRNDWDEDQMWNLMKPSHSGSLYTPAALGKMALQLEHEGKYEEALKIYFETGFQLDAAALLDALTPDEGLEKFIQKYPNHPYIDQVKKALGLRYFWKGDFDRAFALMPKYDWAEKISALKEKLKSASDMEQKAAIQYQLAQFYLASSADYHTPEIWKNIWCGAQCGRMAARSDAEKARAQEFIYRQNRYRMAGLEFKKFVEDYPTSRLHDRALYNYALCQIKSPTYYSNAETDLPQDIFNTFWRIYQEHPRSPLADDALLWAGFYAGKNEGEKAYEEYVKNAQTDDVALFFTPEKVKEIKNHGVFDDEQPYETWGFFSHNLRLRGLNFGDAAGLTLTASVMPLQFEAGEPYAGWLYYRAGGSGLWEANFKGSVKGAEDAALDIHFNGKAVSMTTGLSKTWNLSNPNWMGGAARWVFIHADKMPARGMTLTADMEIKQGSERYSQPVTLSLFPKAGRVGHKSHLISLAPGTVEHCDIMAVDAQGRSYWMFRRIVSLSSKEKEAEKIQDWGRLVGISPDGQIFLDRKLPSSYRQIIFFRDGKFLALEFQSHRLNKNKPMGWLFSEKGEPVSIFPLPPYDRSPQSDAVLVGRDILEEGQRSYQSDQPTPTPGPKVATLPENLTPILNAREGAQRLKFGIVKMEVQPTANNRVQKVHLSGLEKVGYPLPELDLEMEMEESYHYRFSYFGKDARGLHYFRAYDRIFALDGNGKLWANFLVRDLTNQKGYVSEDNEDYFVRPEGLIRWSWVYRDSKIQLDEFFVQKAETH